MPKHIKNRPLAPWLSARADGQERRFIQVGDTLLCDDEFKLLKPGARMLYLCAAMESAGRPSFELPEAAAKKYGFDPRTFRRYVQELEAAGFIETVESGKNTRTPNIYRFSNGWKTQPPAD